MRNQLKPKQLQQRGVVLVVALFIVALVASMALVMMVRLQRDTHRTLLIIRAKQAAYYATGATYWAQDQLLKNWLEKQPKRPVDSPPYFMPRVKVNGYQLQSSIIDLQARFNINNLQNDAAKVPFLRLLQVVAPKLSEQEAKALTNAIGEWFKPLSPDSEKSQYYLHLKPPYRAGQQLMVSLSELRLVKGMSSALYQQLQPYLCALPEASAINVLTAPAEVLTTLSPNLPLDAAQALVAARKKGGFHDKEEFEQFEIIRSHQVKLEPSQVTDTSSYFLLKTEVSIEKQQFVLYTLLKREAGPTKSVIRILWQSKGIW